MKESYVVRCVERWLKDEREYSKKEGYEIICKMKRSGADCIVKKGGKTIVQVETKGSSGDIYSGLGQCLWYFWEESSAETYLAVPYDLPSNIKIEDIRKVMDHNRLNFGLMEIQKNGKPKVIRRTK
jgi:hypothetical protein